MLQNKDNAFNQLCGNLPTWMNGRKRPEKSVTGKFFQSVADEQTQLNQELQKVIDSFFLVDYIGKEDSIIDHVYIANVGLIDTTATITNMDITITDDPYMFLNNSSYALIQDGVLIMHEESVGKNKSIFYTFNGSEFRTDISRRMIWNIFDEFARFSCLERYDGESNYELMQRCLAVFKNPTNSTEDGLKNAIVNSVMNYISIDKDTIKIETPNENNMYIIQGDEPVYEKLSRENMDTMRTKIWDETNWQNAFAETGFITNVWDKTIEYYQDGTGNGQNLKPFMADDVTNEKTNVSVTAYKTSQILIDNYIRRHGIKKNIPIELKKYRDEVKAQRLEYKVTAMPVLSLDPDNVYLKSQKSTTGISKHNLSDLIIDPCDLTVTGGGELEANSEYVIKVYPEDYSDFKIYKAILKNPDGTVTNLLTEQGDYILNQDNVLTNRNIKAHIDSVSKMKNISNIIDINGGGFTLGDKSNEGKLSFNVSNMSGQPIKIVKSCEMTDYTADVNFVKSDGFKLTGLSTWESDSINSTDNITVEMTCSEISFELALDNDPKKQGSVMINCTVDGNPYSPMCGLFSKNKIFNADFGSLKQVVITIKKMGTYPVYIKNICATRYEIELNLDRGIIIQTKAGMTLSGYTGNNTAYMTIRNYGNKIPVISYIHIGNTFQEPYIISNIMTGSNGGYLDIMTDRKMSLYKIISGKEQIQEINYSTRKSYQNKTNHAITVPIDTSNFIKINKSSREITQQLYDGISTSCITIGVGETLYDIDIDGITLVTKSRASISNILNLTGTDKVYIAGNADGFIIRKSSGTSMRSITKDLLPSDSDVFVYENLPNSMNGVFVINSSAGTKSNGTKFDRDFEYTYITPVNNQEYVAYNQCDIVQSPTYTTMSETFSPLIDPLETMLFYKIDKINTSLPGNIKVGFITGTDIKDWSLGRNTSIRIDYDKLNNEENCLYELQVLNEEFEISNTIKLKPIYYKDEYDYEMARWILTPPNDMQIEYEEKDVVERITVKEDNINKLYFSNVINIDYIIIDGDEIVPEKYSLTEKPGIISWKTNEYIGEVAEIAYTYRNPVAMAYKDISSLYNLVGYSTDAYKPLTDTPILLKNMENGDKRTIVFDNIIPDKITAACSNPNFRCVINKNEITVVKSDADNKILIHNGYYYDTNKEYFMFENLHVEKAEEKDHIKYDNVIKNTDNMICNQSSDNYVKNSKFIQGETYRPICRITPEYSNLVKGISTTASITACDSFQLWNTYDMNIDIVKAYNENGLKFIPSSDSGYAILDITALVIEGNVISFYASENLDIHIMREAFTAANDSMARSIYCEEIASVKPIDNNSNYREYVCPDTHPFNPRYYIFIQGEGLLDDIISSEYDPDNPKTPDEIHAKNITVLGFEIEETVKKNMICPIEFNHDGNDFDGLEMNERGIIDTGSNADWGLTRKAFFADDLSNLGTSGGAYIKKDAVITDDESGQTRTPKFMIDNIRSVLTAYVKVNSVLKGKFKNFQITLRGSDTGSSGWIDIKTLKKGNLLEIPGDSLKSYLQVVVDMDSRKVITNIELYLKYAEFPDHDLRIVPNEEGTMTTKIYNIGTSGNWRFCGIDGESSNIDKISFEIRGCRTDKNNAVWTQWYPCNISGSTDTQNNHIFYDYNLFQFRINMSSPDAKLKINNFMMESV